MEYTVSYLKFRESFSLEKSRIEFGITEMQKFGFHSMSHTILPGNESYQCKIHDLNFNDTISYHNDIGTVEDAIHVKDASVEENTNFNYYILTPKHSRKVKKITLFFHGFNEKYWEKYLPWGEAICEKTQSAIVFFPIAFHMQRSPLQWSEKRKMFELSEKRKERFPNIIDSSLSNVAISMRLHYMPQRFIWSGLQTYFDIIQFIKDCKSGKHELIDKDFTVDIFAYSIGGLLAEILKLSDYRNYFSESKVCLFCSGAVFNRLSPVSKFILDSEASVTLYSFLVEHFDSFLKKDPFLRHYIDENHFEGKIFHSMLVYQKMREFRESIFRKAEKQFYAISLKGDTVIPSFEIMNTLQGANRDIHIFVDEIYFDHSYTHENPFPINQGQSHLIDKNFNLVFEKVCNFFNS